MTDTERQMREWLESGTPAEKAHARNRIDLGFGAETAPPPFPFCPHRGVMMESGEKCRCGPKHLCLRDTRIVSAADCTACLAL